MTADRISLDQRLGGRNYAFVTKLIPGLQMAADSAALVGIGYACFYGLVVYSYRTVDFYHVAVVFNWLASLFIFNYAGLYQFDTILKPRRSIDRIAISIVTAFLLMFAAAFSLKISDVFSRIWIAALFLGSIAAVTAERFLVATAITSLANTQMIARRVAVYGRSAQIDQFLMFSERSGNSFLTVVAVFLEDDEKPHDAPWSRLICGNADDLMTFARTEDVDDIIIAMPWSEAGRIDGVLGRLRELPINVLMAADLVGYRLHMGPPPSYYETTPLFQLIGKPLSGWDVVLKALIDYSIATILLVLLFPLFVVVGILIKLDSPGPILFRQQRLGFNNRVFDIYKFRSMAHREKPDAKTIQATVSDPRITRLGRILRKTSIDELPQLLNVLNGTMSLVGPRPHAVDHNEDFAKQIRGYFARHRVKPGITGLAQIKGYRGLTDTVEKMSNRVKYDVQYIETWTPLLDLKILALTPFAVVIGKNAV